MSFGSAAEMTAKLMQRKPDGTFAYDVYLRVRGDSPFNLVNPQFRGDDGNFAISPGWTYKQVLAAGIFLWQQACYNETLKMIFVNFAYYERVVPAVNLQDDVLCLRM